MIFYVLEEAHGESELGQKSPKATTRVGGTPYPPGRALHSSGRPVALLTCTPSLLVVFWSKKNHCKVLFCLDSD